jgi:hypothetical protein
MTSTARCAHCRRPLSVVAARRGRLAYGPVCARRLSLMSARAKRGCVPHKSHKSHKARNAVPIDVRQLQLELEGVAQ